MNLKKVKLIYFSATGTTRKVLESIGKGIAVEDVESIDLTLPENLPEIIQPFSDELVIMGAPVYGGRLPVDALMRFKKLKAEKTPAVLIVTYGNRDFEDSLLEFKHLAIELGFIPFAGGAFIGEHSFSTKDLPIANGRPDSLDVHKAVDFGERIRDKFLALKSLDTPMDLNVPGNFPYEASGPKLKNFSPMTNEKTCTLCSKCAEVCPTTAISISGSVITETERCIFCSACIKSCPEAARFWSNSRMDGIKKWLYEDYSSRKEPQLFGTDCDASHCSASFGAKSNKS